MDFVISSDAFEHQGVIPEQYTCEGQDISPPLKWSGIPKEAKSLALIVDDPDAPDPKAPKMTYVHWILYNIPITVTQLSQGILSSELPEGALQGLNDWRRTGYGGPCPPIGEHRYFFKLYALDTVLPNLGQPSKTHLENAMHGHIIGKTEFIGKYIKKKP